jgi:three-Cys-motif partner protein
VEWGDSNELVKMLVPKLLQNLYRYHFSSVDPFGPDGLKFNTLRELATLNRMDMLIHFPIGAIKRNLKTWLKSSSTILDDFLGTDSWRFKIKVQKLSLQNEYGITLVSLDENFRQRYEPYAASFEERVESLRWLHMMGFKTWVSIEPSQRRIW